MTRLTGDMQTELLTRRRVFALGAAAVATAALAACGGEEVVATATRLAPTVQSGAATTVSGAVTQAPGAAGSITGTVAAAATQSSGAASTVRAAGSAVVGTGQAVGSAVIGTGQAAGSAAVSTGQTAVAPAQAAGGDPASRNNKYAGKMPPQVIDKAKKYTATIVTNKGTMKAELYADTAPITVNNFVFLANEHFYDGVIFHRIVQGFVIQGGDPTGTGMGGPGYKFPDEPIPASRNYEKGTLAMANSGPNTNGSQFFICLDNLTALGKLPKNYNLFGKVIEGLDTIDKIVAVPRVRGGDGAISSPTEKVYMESVTITAM